MKIFQLISLCQQKLYQIIRLSILRANGCRIGKNVKVFGRFTWVGKGENLIIGNGTTINEGVFLNSRDKLIIGNNVHLSPYSQLHTGKLDIYSEIRQHIAAPIIIEDSVWIASGAVISSGVTIGKSSVIAANAVVINDVPANTLVGGEPARVIRSIDINSDPNRDKYL